MNKKFEECLEKYNFALLEVILAVFLFAMISMGGRQFIFCRSAFAKDNLRNKFLN